MMHGQTKIKFSKCPFTKKTLSPWWASKTTCALLYSYERRYFGL